MPIETKTRVKFFVEIGPLHIEATEGVDVASRNIRKLEIPAKASHFYFYDVKVIKDSEGEELRSEEFNKSKQYYLVDNSPGADAWGVIKIDRLIKLNNEGGFKHLHGEDIKARGCDAVLIPRFFFEKPIGLNPKYSDIIVLGLNSRKQLCPKQPEGQAPVANLKKDLAA